MKLGFLKDRRFRLLLGSWRIHKLGLGLSLVYHAAPSSSRSLKPAHRILQMATRADYKRVHLTRLRLN